MLSVIGYIYLQHHLPSVYTLPYTQTRDNVCDLFLFIETLYFEPHIKRYSRFFFVASVYTRRKSFKNQFNTHFHSNPIWIYSSERQPFVFLCVWPKKPKENANKSDYLHVIHFDNKGFTCKCIAHTRFGYSL